MNTPLDDKPALNAFILRVVLYLSLILSATLYVRSIDGEWLISWDDRIYVTENPLIKKITIENIYNIFTSFHFTDYYPITLLSYMFDYYLWELNPVGYRITNILLHSLNGVLVFIIASRLLKGIKGNYMDTVSIALTTCLVFIVHPTAVESVIWVAERKNLLSMTFLLPAFLFYIRHKETSNIRLYFLSMLSFVLALLSKSSAIVLPLLLILYDIAFLRPQIFTKRIWLEKIPFFGIGLLFSLITLYAQNRVGAIHHYVGGSIWYQALVSIRVFAYYIWYSLFPINLSALYSMPFAGYILEPHVLRSLLVLIAIFFYTLYAMRKSPIIFFCIGWFFIPLLPVSGVVPLANVMADRYLYISMTGFALFLSLGIYTLANGIAEKLKSPASVIWIFLIPAVFITIEFSRLTIVRTAVWQDEILLADDVLHKGPKAVGFYSELGQRYLDKGLYDQAFIVLSKALEMVDSQRNPKATASIRYYRGVAFMGRGDHARAEREYEKAIKIYPGLPMPYFSLAVIYSNRDDKEKALQFMENYIRLFKASKHLRLIRNL